MILEIEKNLQQFKKGANIAIKLFLTQFAIDKNILISRDNIVHVNNLELITEIEEETKDVFNFGFNFVLDNIREYRKVLTINPIFYLLFLKQLVNTISYKDLNSEPIEQLKENFLFYKDNSAFKNLKLKLSEVEKFLDNYINNDFFKEVVNICYSLNRIQIKENIINEIEYDPYYSFKAIRYAASDKYKDYDCCFLVDKLDLSFLFDLRSFLMKNNKKCVIFFNEMDDSVKKSLEETKKYIDNIIFIYCPGANYYSLSSDLKKVTEAASMFLSRNEMHLYKFGKIKELIFEAGEVKILGRKFNGNEPELFNLISQIKQGDTESLKFTNRLQMLKQESYIIKVKQEDLEKCRAISSIARSMYNNGIFYTETLALPIFIEMTENNKVKNILINILKEYLELAGCPSTDYIKILNNNDFKLTYNINTYKFDKNVLYVSFEQYLQCFKQIISNIKMLKTLY